MVKQSVNICPKSFTWIIRKQWNYFGKIEYMIEIKELAGCVSYGDTLSEAKSGLTASIELWMLHHGVSTPSVSKQKNVVVIEPHMTIEELHRMNDKLLKLISE